MTFDPTTAVNRQQLIESLQIEFEEASIEVYEDKKPRKHLGASVLGDKCSRRLWYNFRWVKKAFFGGKTKSHGQMLRLFNRGHREEPAIFKVLKQAGHVFAELPTGKQHRLEPFAHGHAGGSVDNIGLLPTKYEFPEWLLYEVKTAQDSSFKKTKKNGVKLDKWQHYVQMCIYGFKKEIKYALYIVVNKNNDEVYMEFVILDWEVGKDHEQKANMIVESQIPPAKYAPSRSHFECSWCDLVDICHDGEAPQKNCRSCHFATAEANGEWLCNQWGETIPPEGIEIGCDKWKGIV